MKLVFLGRFGEMAGGRLADIALPSGVGTLAGLKDWLARAEPELARAMAATPTQIAVNQLLVRDPNHPVSDRDEIAFLPPMSGG